MSRIAEQSPRALTLLAPLAADARALDGEWRVAFTNRPEAERDYAAPDWDDSQWTAVHLPHLRRATAECDTLWYRHRFHPDAPRGDRRMLVRFGGAFYETRVWLNGRDLGFHAGYFQAFGYDVTDALVPGENVLAVRCRFPIEAGAFKRKTAIAGIFADWDCKPYPSTFYPHLPAPHAWTVPLGLWQPAQLLTSGNVLIESLTVLPRVVDPRWTDGAQAARVSVRLQLRNLTGTPQAAHLSVDLAPHNFAGPLDSGTFAVGSRAGHVERDIGLEGNAACLVEIELTLAQPRLWFPWTHGSPDLYHATVTLNGEDSPPDTLTQVFGIRAIQADIAAGRWEWSLNGRRIFPRGSNYIADFDLDRATVDSQRRDVALARAANLDLLRVHAHIGSPDLYRLCDEQGMMVMCDFPLIWTYAFQVTSEQAQEFAGEVNRQMQDMLGLLGSHPGIVLWSIHNEPPWTPDGSFLGADVHDSETNRQIDEDTAHRLRTLDPTRPVIAASGQYDQHLYHGWYTGNWSDNRDLHPTFPTEFGVQALPNLDSPLWGTIHTDWPVEADDPTWAFAGYQSTFWASPGVGAPSQYASLAEYVRESQAYQAFYIRYTIDQWRRQKFQPVGGYVHFMLTDGWPAITWSVLDSSRAFKSGYHALAQVSRPTHVCIDLLDGYQVHGAFHLVYPPGARFQARLYLVNDDYRRSGRAHIAWWIEPRSGWIRKWWHRWTARRVPVELPRADEGATAVGAVDVPLSRGGEYTFCVRLTQNGHVLDDNRYEIRVGASAERRHAPRRVPGFLVTRVYVVGSLRHTGDGFAFKLRNPAMPVSVQRLVYLGVDGQSIDLAQIDLICGGQARRASTISPESPLEFPSSEHLTVLVHGQPVTPAMHELEATGALLGLGELTARWRDRLV